MSEVWCFITHWRFLTPVSCNPRYKHQQISLLRLVFNTSALKDDVLETDKPQTNTRLRLNPFTTWVHEERGTRLTPSLWKCSGGAEPIRPARAVKTTNHTSATLVYMTHCMCVCVCVRSHLTLCEMWSVCQDPSVVESLWWRRLKQLMWQNEKWCHPQKSSHKLQNISYMLSAVHILTLLNTFTFRKSTGTTWGQQRA